jgi:hypothetical protein
VSAHSLGLRRVERETRQRCDHEHRFAGVCGAHFYSPVATAYEWKQFSAAFMHI